MDLKTSEANRMGIQTKSKPPVGFSITYNVKEEDDLVSQESHHGEEEKNCFHLDIV